MTYPLIATGPARPRRASNPAERRRAEDAFMRRHDGWSARALERLFAPAPATGEDGR